MKKTKTKQKTFDVGYYAKIWVNIPIKAESLGRAMELAELDPMKIVYKALFKENIPSFNDFTIDIIGIFDPSFDL